MNRLSQILLSSTLIVFACACLMGAGRKGGSSTDASAASDSHHGQDLVRSCLTQECESPPRGGTLLCQDGEIHDDGSNEVCYGGFINSTDTRYVDKFTPASYPWKYTKICTLWAVSFNPTIDRHIHILMYDDDGPNGGPGTELVNKTVEWSGFFENDNIAALAPMITSGSVYIGVGFDPSVFPHFLCMDETPTTPLNGGYAFGLDGWKPTSEYISTYRAFFIRAAGPIIDCNENFIEDDEDILYGASTDCNANGVPDECDIQGVVSADCNANGIPDECDLQPVSDTYRVDDGEYNFSLGNQDHRDVMWMNQFVVKPGSETISSVDIAWGFVDAGVLTTIYIFDDPDNDPTNSPLNHTLLATATVLSQNPQTNMFTRVPIGPVHVGNAGDSFSIAASMTVDDQFPAALDITIPRYRSWFGVYTAEMFDPSDLSASLIEIGPVVDFFTHGNWLLRANSAPAVPAIDCNENNILDECDLATGGGSDDCNQNMIPDECDTAPDMPPGDAINCNSAVTLEVPGTVAGVTNATLPMDFRQCGLNYSIYPLWGVYRPSSSGTAFFGFDTQTTPFMVSVYDGCPNEGGVQIACNSPNPNGVAFNVQRGHMYYLRWAAIGAGTGGFSGHLVGPAHLPSAGDFNHNGVPDECDCLYDVNHDNVVDMMDFLDARANLGMCLSMPCVGDVDGDGFVDDADLQLILLNLGPCHFPRTSTVQSGHGKGRR